MIIFEKAMHKSQKSKTLDCELDTGQWDHTTCIE